MVGWMFGSQPASKPGLTNNGATAARPRSVPNRCVVFMSILVTEMESVSTAQLATTVSSAKIRSMAQKSVHPVVTTTTLPVSRTCSNLRPETRRSILLAVAGRTSRLRRSDLTSRRHSSRHSRKNRPSSLPSNVSIAPLLHAAGSWGPSRKGFSPAKCIPAPHQAVDDARVGNVGSITPATGPTSVAQTRMPLKSSRSAAPLAGLAVRAVHK